VGTAHQRLEALQVLAIQRSDGTEVHRYAMLNHPVLLQYLVQHCEWPAAVDHKIFGNDLKPVHHWFPGKNVVVVRDAQPDTYTILCEIVKSIGGHNSPRFVAANKKAEGRV